MPTEPPAEANEAAPSPRRTVVLALAFIVVSVVLLTLAAGGVDAMGHTAAHLIPALFPSGCGGG